MTSSLFAIAILILLYIGKFGFRRHTLHELGWRSLRPAHHLMLGLVGLALCTFAVFVGRTVAYGSPEVHAALQKMAEVTISDRLIFAVIGLSAAFLEETVYRGYIQPKLCTRLGPVLGILLTAVFFALIHLNFHPASLVAKTLIGVVLGSMYYLDRTLWSPAIAHALLWIVLGTI